MVKLPFSIRKPLPNQPRYVDQKFLQSYKATVGADFMHKEVVVNGKVINLDVHSFKNLRFGTPQDNKNSEA